MGILYNFFRVLDHIKPAKNVLAHCDIPCGIYDPHMAQMAAHTVIRMVDLINELPPITPDITPQQRQDIIHKLARYTAIKEEHAETCKREIRILWGDYFKPEHVEKYPELHSTVWNVMKLGSKARQNINKEDAKQLLQTVQKIAEIFWKTKGLEPIRVKAPYPSGGDLVLYK